MLSVLLVLISIPIVFNAVSLNVPYALLDILLIPPPINARSSLLAQSAIVLPVMLPIHLSALFVIVISHFLLIIYHALHLLPVLMLEKSLMELFADAKMESSITDLDVRVVHLIA